MAEPRLSFMQTPLKNPTQTNENPKTIPGRPITVRASPYESVPSEKAVRKLDLWKTFDFIKALALLRGLGGPNRYNPTRFKAIDRLGGPVSLLLGSPTAAA